METGKWKIENFTVSDEEAEFHNMRAAFSGQRGMSIKPGTYKRLMKNGLLWMSNTPAEVFAHYEILRNMKFSAPNASVLIHGLGLGMVLQAALETENVSSVDVVEIDTDLIDMVGPFYRNMAEENKTELNILCGDALNYKFPSGKRWNFVWHDIWQDICEDNKPDMAKLRRRYGRRCDWQGVWQG